MSTNIDPPPVIDSDSDNDIVDLYDITESLVKLHASHPLFLHRNDHSGMLLVSHVLNENDYHQWQRSMKVALSAKNKIGMINGTNIKPPISSKYYEHWVRCNDMIVAWLLNVVSTEIISSIVYVDTACDIWDDLNTRLTQSNAPQILSSPERNCFFRSRFTVS